MALQWHKLEQIVIKMREINVTAMATGIMTIINLGTPKTTNQTTTTKTVLGTATSNEYDDEDTDEGHDDDDHNYFPAAKRH